MKTTMPLECHHNDRNTSVSVSVCVCVEVINPKNKGCEHCDTERERKADLQRGAM